MPREMIQKIVTIAGQIAQKIEGILHRIEDNKALANIKTPELEKEKTKISMSPYALAFIIATAAISIFANYLFVKVAHINIQITNYLFEFFVFVFVAQFFISRFRKKQIEKQNRKELEILLDEQFTVNKAKNEFIKDVGNNLKQELIKLDEVIQDTDDSVQIMAGLKDGKARLEGIISKFDMFSKMERANIEKRLSPVHFQNLVDESIKSRSNEIQNKRLTINYTDLFVTVFQDMELLDYVMDSIISNAIKFSKQDGDIQIKAENKDGEIVFSVEDHGIGIAKDDLAHLFKPFSRAGSALDFNYEGMGFDLYLDKIIMKFLGGNISVESVQDKGTKVSLNIPDKRNG